MDRRWFGKIKNVLLWVIPMVLLALPVRAYLFSVFDHNEHMYLAAAEGLASGKTLYKDFAFLQMPLQPWGIWFVKVLSFSTSWIWSGKTLSWLAWIGVCVTTFLLVQKGEKTWLSATLVALCVGLHPTVLRCAMESSNYILPAWCCLMAWWNQKHNEKSWGAFAAGCWMALAVSTKLFYLAFLPFIFLSTPKNKRYWSLAGITIGLWPALYYLFRFPDDFFFQNWTFHHMTSAWRASLNSGTGFTWIQKLQFFKEWLAHWPTAVWMMAGLWVGFQHGKKQGYWQFGLGMAVFVLSIFVAVYPAPLFEQYMLLPWLGGVFLLSQAPRFSFRVWIILALVHVWSDPMGILYRPFRSSFVSESIAIGEKIKAEGASSDWNVAGFSPTYGLEAGLTIPDVWRTGIFLSRLDERLHDDERWIRLMDMDTALTKMQPEVIITGEEGAYDNGLASFAQTHSYRLLEGTGHLKVWILPK